MNRFWSITRNAATYAVVQFFAPLAWFWRKIRFRTFAEVVKELEGGLRDGSIQLVQKGSMEYFIGEIWKNKHSERKILDLVHEGFYPDDPNDMGSFEEFNVHYEDSTGKHVCSDTDFEIWVRDTEAKLIYEPKYKEGYRDCPGVQQ